MEAALASPRTYVQAVRTMSKGVAHLGPKEPEFNEHGEVAP